jgi:pimeloyl-ACP methyl ester carboxylesterase
MSVPPRVWLDKEVRRDSVSAGSGALAALVGTPPDDVEVVGAALLVPGYTGSKEDFLPILAPLCRAGYKVVAIDLRGQHESTGPDDPSAYTIEAHAKDVAELLAELGPGTHLVGHSYGGLVTRQALIAGARPASHLLVGSGPGALPGRRAATIPGMLQLVHESGTAALADLIAEIETKDPRVVAVDNDVRAFLHERRLLGSPVALRVMGEELLAAPDQVEALTGSGVPTLVVFGEADDAWPPEVQREMAARLGVDVVAIPDAGHSPACEAPDAFVDVLLSFWARCR